MTSQKRVPRPPRYRRGIQGDGPPRHQALPQGDVFQIVLSRRFEQPFKGDDFKVYRALRSINPSPYLFYFDFGGFRIFGSSPETHCKVTGGHASIDPIAGTAFRTGNIEVDKQRTEAPACRPQGERRARDAGRPRPQRPKPERPRRASGFL